MEEKGDIANGMTSSNLVTKQNVNMGNANDGEKQTQTADSTFYILNRKHFKSLLLYQCFMTWS